jgi:hypothetical protein
MRIKSQPTLKGARKTERDLFWNILLSLSEADLQVRVVAQYEIGEVDWNGALGRLVISFRCSSIWSLWLWLLFRCDLDE